mmetsp:Transcript_12712/g.19113  ORF Transcript_12712/g.19113 Transcript_12712/m.19113 type:complete len:189 (+) Transcript_12712:82-648(+)
MKKLWNKIWRNPIESVGSDAFEDDQMVPKEEMKKEEKKYRTMEEYPLSKSEREYMEKQMEASMVRFTTIAQQQEKKVEKKKEEQKKNTIKKRKQKIPEQIKEYQASGNPIEQKNVGKIVMKDKRRKDIPKHKRAIQHTCYVEKPHLKRPTTIPKWIIKIKTHQEKAKHYYQPKRGNAAKQRRNFQKKI